MKYAGMHARQNGFFLIEVVVAASVIATVLILLLGSVQDSVEASKRSLERTQSSYLLEGGAEAVKAVRDNGWSTITSLTDGTGYYLSWSGSSWSLTTDVAQSDTTDPFIRTVTVAPVYRDDNDDIVDASGTLDSGTKKVTITVSWPTPSGVKTEALEFFIADIR